MFTALAFAAALSQPCKVEDARYALRSAPAFTADFKDVDSGADWNAGVALHIHSANTGKDFWFLPGDGGSSGLLRMVSTEPVDAPGWRPPSPDGGPRPLGDFDYIPTDASYNILDALPERGGEAPTHFLLLELSDALWHNVLGPRESASKQFFDLVRCGAG